MKVRKKSETLFDGDSASIILPSVSGYIEILLNHAPLNCVLSQGKITVDSKEFDIDGGLACISDNNIFVCCD